MARQEKLHACWRSLLTVLFVLFASGCSEEAQFTGECAANTDCASGFICRGGLCICRGDESCADGEFCNLQGICQTRPGCRANTDCDETKFCDIATGRCIEKTQCGTDAHCPTGTVCDTTMAACVPGCHDNGDCPLYAVCERPVGSDPKSLGMCFAGRCGDKTFCEYGSDCMNGSCIQDPNPNHCAPCNNQPNDCGGGGNFCLINPNYTPGDPSNGSQYFCGVECSAADDCPNGYGCGGVVLLTQDLCTPGNDAECGGGGRRCVAGEGDLTGNCTCVADADCTIDEVPAQCLGDCGGLGLIPCQVDQDCSDQGLPLPCDLANRACQWPQGQGCSDDSQCQPLPLCAPVGAGGSNICVTDGSPCASSTDCLCIASAGNRCFGTGRPCTSGAECALSCQNGGCLLGAACAPNEGLDCQDVR